MSKQFVACNLNLVGFLTHLVHEVRLLLCLYKVNLCPLRSISRLITFKDNIFKAFVFTNVIIIGYVNALWKAVASESNDVQR